MNTCIKVSVCKGCLEVSDDGESLNLLELLHDSVMIKSLKEVCKFEIRTRTKIGLYSEQLCNDGLIKKVQADRVYRNVFIVKDFYKSQSLKSKLALEGLGRFDMVLKAVVIENCQVDWKYECEESKSNWTIKMKTKLARSLALFKGKNPFIFENTEEGLIARSEIRFGPPITLINGFPCFDVPEFDGHRKNVFYINKTSVIEQQKALVKESKKMTGPNKAKPVRHRRRDFVQAKGNCCFKGTRETLDSFKATCDQSIPGQSRDFIKDLVVIGQFDKKAILAMRNGTDGSKEIWIFDQHACDERINLEKFQRSGKEMTRDEMNMKACRSAFKFGDSLTYLKQEEIIKSLEECNEPFHCAHGRPTCWLLAKLK